MHFLAGLAILAALLWLAFGERTARLFVGWALATTACWVLLLIGIATTDIMRQSSQPRMVKRVYTPPAGITQVSPQDLTAIWQRIDERDARR